MKPVRTGMGRPIPSRRKVNSALIVVTRRLTNASAVRMRDFLGSSDNLQS